MIFVRKKKGKYEPEPGIFRLVPGDLYRIMLWMFIRKLLIEHKGDKYEDL
jgi:hypothetical protein